MLGNIYRLQQSLAVVLQGTLGGGGRGEGGCLAPLLQIMSPFQTKTCHVLYPFSDLAFERCSRSANPLPCLNESEVNISLYFKWLY